MSYNTLTYVKNSLDVLISAPIDVNSFQMLKTMRTRHCCICRRLIPPKTWILMRETLMSRLVKGVSANYQTKVPMQRNFCAICAPDILTNILKECKNKMKYFHKARLAIARSPKNGYCCESWRLSERCMTCKKSLSCFTTMKEKEVE